jgi:hypothetical protein
MNLLILNKNTKKAQGKGEGKGKRPAESEWAHQKNSHHAEPCEGPSSIKLHKKSKNLSAPVTTKTLATRNPNCRHALGIQSKQEFNCNIIAVSVAQSGEKTKRTKARMGDTFNIEMALIVTHRTNTIWERNRDTWSSSVARQKRHINNRHYNRSNQKRAFSISVRCMKKINTMCSLLQTGELV